jgi:hypothetical protein
LLTQVALIVVGLTLMACGGSDFGPSQPAVPSVAPSPPSASPPTSPPTSGGFRLSGIVLETTAQGPRPVGGGRVFFWIDSRNGQVLVDASGRYVIAGLAAAPVVRLTWLPGVDRLDLSQPCPTTVAMPEADIERDIQVVRTGSQDVRYESPTVSGMVYESTADGRRLPLPRTRVLYSIGAWGGFDVYTDTDANGRYLFCRIPKGTGAVGAGDCNDSVFFVPVQVNGDTVVDVDLRPFKEACP